MEMEKNINQIAGVKWVEVEKGYDLSNSPACGSPLLRVEHVTFVQADQINNHKFMLLYFINNDLWQKRYGCWRHTDLAKLWTLAFFLVLIWISICIQTEKYYILHLYKYNIYIYNLFIVHWNKNGF